MTFMTTALTARNRYYHLAMLAPCRAAGLRVDGRPQSQCWWTIVVRRPNGGLGGSLVRREGIRPNGCVADALGWGASVASAEKVDRPQRQ
jgi:hypothetical protein